MKKCKKSNYYLIICLLILTIIFVIGYEIKNIYGNSYVDELEIQTGIYIESEYKIVYDEVINKNVIYIKTESIEDVDDKVLIEEVKTYTDEDLEVLTRVLTGEAHTYSDEHQLLVGSVVINRVKSNKFPNTIKEVVFQKGQYACVKDGNYYREPTERNIANAKYLLENGSILPENCLYQAEFRQGSGVYKKIGGTYICYE